MAKFCNKFFPHLDWNKKANYFIEIRWETNLISQNASDHQYVTYIRGNTSKISKKKKKKLAFIFFTEAEFALLQLEHRFKYNMLRGLKVFFLM